MAPISNRSLNGDEEEEEEGGKKKKGSPNKVTRILFRFI